MSRLTLGLEFEGELPPQVRSELEQIVAALQAWQIHVAPGDAEFLVAATHSDLTEERAVVNTPTVIWDFGTDGQAKAHAVSGAFGAGYMMGSAVMGDEGSEGQIGQPGPVGPTGGTGAQGPQGVPGTGIIPCFDGEDGDAYGLPGPMGPQGATGAAGSSGALVLLEEHTASASASLNFTTAISSTYDEYQIEVLNLIPATDAVSLYLRMSTDGGSSYDSGSNYWTDAGSWRSGLGWNATGGGSGTAINFGTNGNTVDNSTTRGCWFSMRLLNPGSTALYKQVFGQGGVFYSDGATRVMLNFGGEYTSTTAVNAFQFLFSSGNIASGTVRCYGIAKT